MTVLVSTAFKTATLNSLLRGTSNTYPLYAVALYTGSIPASGDSAVTGTLLHSTISNGYQNLAGGSKWSAPSNGACALSTPVSPVTVTVAGTPGYAQVVDQSGSTTMFYVDVGVAGSGAGAILSSMAPTSVGVLQPALTNFSFSWPDTLVTVKLNTALRNALCGMWCQAAANLGMANSGAIKIYSGSAPSSADVAATGTLLATFTTSNSSWSAPAGGACALAASLSVSAAATGTAGYARFSNSAGTYVIQMSVGTSGADITMDSLSLTSGSTTQITNATVSI